MKMTMIPTILIYGNSSSTWYRESGEDFGENGFRCRWARMGGQSDDGTSEWKEMRMVKDMRSFMYQDGQEHEVKTTLEMDGYNRSDGMQIKERKNAKDQGMEV